jgi:predicted neutral ceramidase superfamily lipid hydrolase
LLITNKWAKSNKLDYIIIIGHFTYKFTSIIKSLLLNIIELINPVYNSLYLANKLLEVINRLSITCIVILIIKDNIALNNTMLDKFKVVVFI